MSYTAALQKHFEDYFKIKGHKQVWNYGPKEKLNPDFYILEFKPNAIHDMWAYCTCGMSSNGQDKNLIELIIYAPRQDKALIELLTLVANSHKNDSPINLNHTLNIGKPWLDNSKCNHGFISLPYLDGEDLELFEFDDKTVHCYWFIPITEAERDYKIENGYEALEDLFEEKQFDYLNPSRISLVN